jgi:hypothetical protein
MAKHQAVIEKIRAGRYDVAELLVLQTNAKRMKSPDVEPVLSEIALALRTAIHANHQAYIGDQGLPYRGIRDQRGMDGTFRVSWCHACARRLDNRTDVECRACGWMVCYCGACGCGYKKKHAEYVA